MWPALPETGKCLFRPEPNRPRYGSDVGSFLLLAVLSAHSAGRRNDKTRLEKPALFGRPDRLANPLPFSENLPTLFRLLSRELLRSIRRHRHFRTTEAYRPRKG